MTRERDKHASNEGAVVSSEENRELVRHIRNLLAVVRALARQSTEGDQRSDEDCARLAARIDAFARVQSALLRDIAAGADLETLILDELSNFGVRSDGKIRVEGVEIRLSARAAGLVALLIHELSFGALIDGDGALSVGWRAVPDDGSIELSWRDRSSDGGRFDWLSRAFAYELKGSLRRETDGAERQWVAVIPSINLAR